MSLATVPARDRRRAPRVDVSGRAVIGWCDEFSTPYSLEDLSSTGALLSGASCPPIGTQLELLIRPPALGPVCYRATVVRHAASAGQAAFGVAFHHMSRRATTMLEDTMFPELPGQNEPRIVVVGRAGVATTVLRNDLKTIGYRTIAVANTTRARLTIADEDTRAAALIILSSEVGKLETASLALFAKAFAVPVVISERSIARADEWTDSGFASAILRDPWTFEDVCRLFLTDPLSN